MALLSNIFSSETTTPPDKFEQSVFELVAKQVSDRKALGEELESIESLKLLPVNDESRQKKAAELYLLLERNIAEEQTKNRVPKEVLRAKIFSQCHPERAEGNFALFFLPHYERQIKLLERFVVIALLRAKDVLGPESYTSYMDLVGQILDKKVIKNGEINWAPIEQGVQKFTPPEQRDMIQSSLKQVIAALITALVNKIGDMRIELLLQEIYHQYHDPIDFIEDVAKPLNLVSNDYLKEQRIELLEKSQLEAQLREKSTALETTLAQVQAERLKLSEMTREELERKVQERTAELVAALKTAQEARRNLEEFSSLATHELRAPVGAMKGYINLVTTDKNGALNDAQKKYLNEVVQANDRLLTLINAMLDVSRIELGTLAIDPSPVSIVEIADNVITELAAKIEEKKQTLTKNYDSALPTMNLDPSLMHAIFINLISNAAKYTPEGGAITLSIQNQDPKILITVSDTGMGIPEAQQSKIFEKLFRADNAKSQISEGTGLGLYLVKSILDQTGGTIRFESKENQGTTFYVTIPLSGMQKKEGTRGLN